MAGILVILPLLAASYFGTEIVSLLLYKSIELEMRILLGSIFGIQILSLVFVIISMLFKLNFLIGIYISFFFLFLALVIHAFSKPSQSQALLPNREYILLIIIPTIIVSFILFNGSFTENSQVTHPQYNLLPQNVAFINSIAFGANSYQKIYKNFIDTYLSQTNYKTPNLPDFLSACLIKCFDCSIHSSLIIPSFIYIYASFYLFAKLSLTFTSSSVSLVFSVLTFLFFGGRGYLFLVQPNLLRDMDIDFMSNWGNNRYQFCFHPIFQILIGQRTTLFAFPICLSLIILLINDEYGKQSKASAHIFCGILLSLLSLIEINAFYSLLIWTIIFSTFQLIFTLQQKKILLISKFIYFYAAFIVLTALLCILGVFPMPKFFIFRPLWYDIEKSFFKFLNNGMHMFLLYSLLHGTITLDRKQLMIYFPSIFVFLFSILFRYQESIFFNYNLILYCFIPLSCAAIGNFLKIIWTKITSHSILFLVLIVLPLWTSGIVYFIRSFEITHVFTNPVESFEIGTWIKENTDPDSIWISNLMNPSPVNIFAGRQMFSFHENSEIEKIRYKISNSILSNPDNISLSDMYNISYIFIDFSQSSTLSKLLQSNNWELVLISSSYYIFKRFIL